MLKKVCSVATAAAQPETVFSTTWPTYIARLAQMVKAYFPHIAKTEVVARLLEYNWSDPPEDFGISSINDLSDFVKGLYNSRFENTFHRIMMHKDISSHTLIEMVKALNAQAKDLALKVADSRRLRAQLKESFAFPDPTFVVFIGTERRATISLSFSFIS